MKQLLIILLLPCFLQAQTRNYLGISTTSPLPSVTSSTWEVTTNATRLMLYDYKDNSAITSVQSANTGAASVRDLLIRSFVTVPLAAQTLASGVIISGQIRGSISSTSSRSGRGKILVRVLNADGTLNAEVGTITTTNYTTTLTNRTYSLTLGSSVSIPAGGRLLFEIGWEYLTGTNTATNGTNSFGANAASDLPTDNTTTTANNGFINISVTVAKQKIGFF